MGSFYANGIRDAIVEFGAVGKLDCVKNDMREARMSFESNKRAAQRRWLNISSDGWQTLKSLTSEYQLSVSSGDVILLDGRWFVTHSGLLALARRNRCRRIHVEAVAELCDMTLKRFVLRATVYPFKSSVGFVGYGDADPSNVSEQVRGAEMRIAETRAVNRALRKAYGIGICSVEEIGTVADRFVEEPRKLPPQPTNGNSQGRTVRDRLCQIIHRYRLDPNLVKAYATDSCGVKALRDATREQIENFVVRLADWAEKDLDALRCQLNSYVTQKEEAA